MYGNSVPTYFRSKTKLNQKRNFYNRIFYGLIRGRVLGVANFRNLIKIISSAVAGGSQALNELFEPIDSTNCRQSLNLQQILPTYSSGFFKYNTTVENFSELAQIPTSYNSSLFQFFEQTNNAKKFSILPAVGSPTNNTYTPQPPSTTTQISQSNVSNFRELGQIPNTFSIFNFSVIQSANTKLFRDFDQLQTLRINAIPLLQLSSSGSGLFRTTDKEVKLQTPFNFSNAASCQTFSTL